MFRISTQALVVSLALLASAARAVEPSEAPPAREGVRLVEALEAAPLAVVGEVSERASLDRHGWRATLALESVLVGDVQEGALVPIAWEELSSERPPRFAKGDRVLVVLEPPSGSLWRARFPDVNEYVRVRVVAQGGLAFLRRPSLGSLQQLHHYLALPVAERAGPAGQGHLLALAAEAEPPLAVSAAARLAELAGVGDLEPERAALALRALARADQDAALAAELLAWIERSQPGGLAPQLDQALAQGARAPALFVRARGLLPGGVDSERLAALLAGPSAAHRAAAASVANASARDRLARLARSDPAPEVRSAALQRLATLDGPAALETLLAAFSDREASVRNEAAEVVAGLGSAAVPRLREVALGWPSPAPETAVSALRACGAPQAAEVLRELADAHPDPRVRGLAGLAIGRPLGHAD